MEQCSLSITHCPFSVIYSKYSKWFHFRLLFICLMIMPWIWNCTCIQFNAIWLEYMLHVWVICMQCLMHTANSYLLPGIYSKDKMFFQWYRRWRSNMFFLQQCNWNICSMHTAIASNIVEMDFNICIWIIHKYVLCDDWNDSEIVHSKILNL